MLILATKRDKEVCPDSRDLENRLNERERYKKKSRYVAMCDH